MSKQMKKYNEFINNNDVLIKDLIKTVENNNFSDRHKIYELSEYKKIIEIGNFTIPILLETLNDNNLWVEALSKITGVETDENLKLSSEVSDFWKKWGIDNGYI